MVVQDTTCFVLLSLIFIVSGSSGVQKDSASMSVMEGDSVTLNTDCLITKNQQDRFIWYFNDIRIVQIVGDERKICTDVQCEERFRDRLKLDHVTGSLTITNINTTDSGDYQLKIIISGGSISEKIFSVSVRGVPGLDKVKTKSVKEGESVTFDPGVMKNTNDVMTWYFNETLITEITGDQSPICTDDQCKERFRDRLKLDHVTGSLTITNTKTTDSGVYKLEITSRSSIGRRRRRSISITNLKSFSVSVIAVPGSGLSSAAVAGIVVVVLLVFAAVTAAVIYYHHRSHTPVPQNDL